MPLSAGQATKSQKKVKKAESAERRAMRFRGMDANGDGVITRDEWRGNAQAFNRHDANHDGVLSGAEVWPAADAQASADWRERAERDNALAEAFLRADRNHDGTISRSEWTSDASSFDRVDTNRDGVITRTEYLGEGWGEQVEDTDTAARRDSRAYRSGYDRGLPAGRQAGKEDKEYRNQWDLEGQRELEQADAGYATTMGTRSDYQAGYRAGFRAGYRQAFGPR